MSKLERIVGNCLQRAISTGKEGILYGSNLETEHREFEFKPLEEVKYKETTLGEKIKNLETKISNLEKENQILKEALIKLADSIDKSKFL